MKMLRVDGYPDQACVTAYTQHGVTDAAWLWIMPCGCGALVCDGCHREIQALPRQRGRCPAGHESAEAVRVFVPLDEDPDAFRQIIDAQP